MHQEITEDRIRNTTDTLIKMSIMMLGCILDANIVCFLDIILTQNGSYNFHAIILLW